MFDLFLITNRLDQINRNLAELIQMVKRLVDLVEEQRQNPRGRFW